MKYKNETRNDPRIALLIKDSFFPVQQDGDSLVRQIKHYACHYVALLPTSEKTLTLSRMEAIMVAIKGNPVMCLKWATRSNINAIAKYKGWDSDTKECKYPNVPIANTALQLLACLLDFCSYTIYHIMVKLTKISLCCS